MTDSSARRVPPSLPRQLDWLERFAYPIDDIELEAIVTDDPSWTPVRLLGGLYRDPRLAQRLGVARPRLVIVQGPTGAGRHTAIKWALAQSRRSVRAYRATVGINAPNKNGWPKIRRFLPRRGVLSAIVLDSVALEGASRFEFSHDPNQRSTLVALRDTLAALPDDPNLTVILVHTDADGILSSAITDQADYIIELPEPPERLRRVIVERELATLPLAEPVDVEALVSHTSFTLRDSASAPEDGLARLSHRFAHLRDTVAAERPAGLTRGDLMTALDWVGYGDDELRHDPTIDDDLRSVAYHEAGHAAAAIVLNGPETCLLTTIVRAGNGKHPGQEGYVMRSHGTVTSRSAALTLRDGEQVASAERLAITAAGRLAGRLFSPADTGCAHDYESMRAAIRISVGRALNAALTDSAIIARHGMDPETRDATTPAILDALCAEIEAEAMRAAREIVATNAEPIARFAASMLANPLLAGAELRAAIDAAGFVTPIGRLIRCGETYEPPRMGLPDMQTLPKLINARFAPHLAAAIERRRARIEPTDEAA